MLNDNIIKLGNLNDYYKYIEDYTNNSIEILKYKNDFYGINVNPKVLDNLDPYNCKRFTDFMKNNLNNLDNNILEKLQYSYYDNFVRYDGCPIGSDELVKFTPNNCKCKNGLKCDFNDRDCKSSICPFKIKNLKENKIQTIKDEQNKQSRFIRKDIMDICVSIIENSGFATVQYKNKYFKVRDFDLDIDSLKLSFLVDRDKFKHSIGDKVEKLNFEYSRGLEILQNGDIIDIGDEVYQSNDEYKSNKIYKKVVILFKSLDVVP